MRKISNNPSKTIHKLVLFSFGQSSLAIIPIFALYPNIMSHDKDDQDGTYPYLVFIMYDIDEQLWCGSANTTND